MRKKIIYLAPGASIHTVKWLNFFQKQGYEMHLITMHPPLKPLNSLIKVHLLLWKAPFGYYLNYFRVKKLINKLKPDLLHTHYASGYGTLSRLINFHPNVLSVWGNDIFDFPKKSFFHKKMIGSNLKKADYIGSTSHIMARETNKYTDKKILITPFGANCEEFKPMPKIKPQNKIIIGTIKTLKEDYGIEYLIEAFNILVKKYPNLPLELHIGGKGNLKKKLQKLCKDLNVENKTKFLGYILHNKVPRIFNTFSVSVVISVAESFGVAVVEAEACGIPVVVSNVGGLPEVVENGITGFIVPPRNPEDTALAIEKLILDKNLRNNMSKAGREFILKNYEWNKNAKIMEDLYKKIVGR